MRKTVFITPRVQSLPRRTLLRGGCGVAIALPFLEIMRAKPARAQASAKKNLLVFMTGNGIVPSVWWPKKTGTDETSFSLEGTSLQPLADQGLQKDVVIVSGVSNKVYPSGNRPHPKATAQCLTATPLMSTNFPTGISLDQLVSKSLDPDRRSLELGVISNRSDAAGTISYTSMGTPLPRENDPSRVFARLFTNNSMPSDPTQLMRLKASRRSILDFARRDCNRLNARLGQEDRARFEKYCEELTSIEKGLDRLNIQSCEPPKEGGAPVAHLSQPNAPQTLKLQIELMLKAMSCGLVRVASLMFGYGGEIGLKYSWLGFSTGHHTMSHEAPAASLAKIDRWSAEQFAHLLKRLKETSGPDGTSLYDSSLLMWVNEMGLGSQHSTERLPFVFAGRLGGRLRTGRYVDVGRGSPSSGRLFVSVANAYDIPIKSFGQASVGTGALDGIFS